MIEQRKAGNASVKAGQLVGVVTPFGVQTTINDPAGSFREQVAEGAFTKTLAERGSEVVLLWNHDMSQPLARVGAGNLQLSQQRDGLHMQATPVQTAVGKDVLALVQAGVVKGMSFGFQVTRDAWSDSQGNPSDCVRGTQRTIQEVRLFEVSAVTAPAYPTTTLSAREDAALRALRSDARSERESSPVLQEFARSEARSDAFQAARREMTAEFEYRAIEMTDRAKYNQADRDAAAKSGAAMPDGSFPIKDAEDLENAIHLAGNAKDPAAARKHIIARAKALGLLSKIPDTWTEDRSMDNRDAVDGDSPQLPPFAPEQASIWSHGAICDLFEAYPQLQPHVQQAVQTVHAYLQSIQEQDTPLKTVDGGTRAADDAAEELRLIFQLAQARIQAV